MTTIARGTLVPPDECALVSVNHMADLELLLPDLPEGNEIPPVAAYLAACALRFKEDPEFVHAQLHWLDSRNRHLDA